MTTVEKPFVQLAVDEVDTIIHDPEGHYDSDHYDRYETFETARDAALTSIEVMLDEADYDGDDHREELEKMHELLERAVSLHDLETRSDYQAFLRRVVPAQTIAA